MQSERRSLVCGCLTRNLLVVAVLPAAAGLLVACGGGTHETVSTATTGTTPVAPRLRRLLSLVVADFPSRLNGSLTFSIDRKHGNPAKAGGWRRVYSIELDHVGLRLAKVTGRGAKRTAAYTLVSATPFFRGYEDVTSSTCETTHTVWRGRAGRPLRGTVEVYGAKFDSSVGYVFLVPQRGTTTTRRCGSARPGREAMVTRTARIVGNGSLGLYLSKVPQQRFVIGIEVQSKSAGPIDSGGYRIDGKLKPPADGSVPVTLCRPKGKRLSCAAS